MKASYMRRRRKELSQAKRTQIESEFVRCSCGAWKAHKNAFCMFCKTRDLIGHICVGCKFCM